MEKSDFKILEEKGLFYLLRRKSVKNWIFGKWHDEFFVVNKNGSFTYYDPGWGGWQVGKPYCDKSIDKVKERISILTKPSTFHEV